MHSTESKRSAATRRPSPTNVRRAHPALVRASDASSFNRGQQAAYLGIKLPQLSNYLNHGVPRTPYAVERIERLVKFIGYRGPRFEGRS